MNWENKFSTMVKESSAKIDQAKRRLQNFDTSRIDSLKNTGSDFSPAGFQNRPEIHVCHGLVSNKADFQSGPLLHESSGSASVSLLHTLWEKVERQSQVCDTLKTQVETLQTKLTEQQKEMEHFKEHLSQLCLKVDEPAQDDLTLEEWKTEIKNELNYINSRLLQRGDDDPIEWKSTTYERERSPGVEKNALVMKCIDEIKNRLDKIEGELSYSHHNAENNSKMVEKNIMLLTDWKNSNEHSLTRLCKMQDLSVDEVKHLRSKFYSMQDKVHELETAMNNVRLNKSLTTVRKQSNSIVEDGKDVILEIEKCTRLHLSSDSSEEHQSCLTGSSLNLDVSENGDLSLDNEDLSLEHEDLSLENGDLSLENEDLSLENGDLSLENGDLSLENEDLSLENGDLSLENGDLSLENGDLSLENGDLSLENDVLNEKESSRDQITSRNSGSELEDSSIDSLSGSDSCLNDI